MKEINSLEISFLMKKLKEDLVSSKIQKIKTIGENSFLFEIYKQKKRKHLVISDKTLFLTDKNFNSTDTTNFFQILKKHLLNQIIEDVKQHEFDRIVEIETKDYLLIAEFFGKGNLILTNSDRKIISALILRSWKDRSILPKREYVYPPSRINPFKLNQSGLEEYFGKKEAVVVLAVDLGFGGELARDICYKLDIDGDSKKVDVSKIYKFFKRIDSEFKELENVNERLKKEFEEDLKKTFEEKTIDTKSERIKKAQEEALKKWQEKEIFWRNIGKLLYERYEDVKQQLDFYKKKIMIDGIEIELDPRKSVQRNAEVYFERAKTAKKKIEGIIKSMQRMKNKKIVQKGKKEPEFQPKREWHDNFRWIISSEGFLLVGGKDAKTNEQLIRKHMEENDLVFHTDITGSPFVLIKNPDKKEIPQQTIKEAAEFCGSYSKAWKIGVAAVDVYYIKPDQVKKEGGLPTGSFMIYGKREWIRRIPVRIVVGTKDDKLYFGPESAVKKNVTNFVLVVPGDYTAHEISKEIQKRLKTNINIEKIERIIPYGRGKLIGE
jgi:predicted ribosome quality control (RQC) complex YloA/Tae2 family protein